MTSALTRLGRALTIGLTTLLTASFLGGCIGQGQYDRLYETNRSLTAQLGESNRERDEARAQLDLLRRNYGNSSGAIAELQKQNDELRRQLDAALGDYKSLEGRLAGLNFGPVDAQTDRALAELAAQYPDLIKYDSARGMLRFASDLTFDSGSDVVKDSAKSALSALANILNSGPAAGYDVVVEGHTDSQRIANPATAREHKTNRRLSAHRAVSVIDELGKLGVPGQRLMAAGWGEHRPAVANSPNGNTPQNRRVEIFLVKSTGAAPAAETVTEPRTETTPTKQPEVDMTK